MLPLSNLLRFYPLKTQSRLIRVGNQLLASKENYWRLSVRRSPIATSQVLRHHVGIYKTENATKCITNSKNGMNQRLRAHGRQGRAPRRAPVCSRDPFSEPRRGRSRPQMFRNLKKGSAASKWGFTNQGNATGDFTTSNGIMISLRTRRRRTHADISPLGLVRIWHRAQLSAKRDHRFVRELHPEMRKA